MIAEKKFDILLVKELPKVGNPGIIYLKPKEKSEILRPDNNYDEFIWVNSENGEGIWNSCLWKEQNNLEGSWEFIGDSLQTKTISGAFKACYTECSGDIINLKTDLPGFELERGRFLYIKMLNTIFNILGTVTLSINDSNPFPIVYENAPVTINNKWQAGDVLLMLFDGHRFITKNLSSKKIGEESILNGEIFNNTTNNSANLGAHSEGGIEADIHNLKVIDNIILKSPNVIELNIEDTTKGGIYYNLIVNNTLTFKYFNDEKSLIYEDSYKVLDLVTKQIEQSFQYHLILTLQNNFIEHLAPAYTTITTTEIIYNVELSRYHSANNARGLSSHAEGLRNNADGLASHAEGYMNLTKGGASHVEGYQNKVFAQAGHAEGYGTISSNIGEHAEGTYNVSNSHPELEVETISSIGIGTSHDQDRKNAVEVLKNGDVYVKNIGNYNGVLLRDGQIKPNVEPIQKALVGKKKFTIHNLDYNTIPSDDPYLNIGEIFNDYELNKAQGKYSHAEGKASSTTVTADAAHVEGYNNTVTGGAGHAEGYQTESRGQASHTEGYGTVTLNDHEHAEGQFNKSNNLELYIEGGQTISSVGIGINKFNRKNALEIFKNGLIYINGLGNFDGSNLYAEGTSDPKIKYKVSATSILQIISKLLKHDFHTFVFKSDKNLEDITKLEFLKVFSTDPTILEPFTMCPNVGDIFIFSKANAPTLRGYLKGYIVAIIGDIRSADNLVPFLMAIILDSYLYYFAYDSSTLEVTKNKIVLPGQFIENGGEIFNSYVDVNSEEKRNIAAELYSHAEGQSTEATKKWSHAEGYKTKAKGEAAHAEGTNTLAFGTNSHVEGEQTVAWNEHEHAEGKCNNSSLGSTTATKTLSSIGFGTKYNDRKNALEVTLNGDIYINKLGNYSGVLLNSRGEVKTEDNKVISSLLKVIDSKADDATIREYISQQVGGAFKIKGTVSSFEELEKIKDVKNGDVYIVNKDEYVWDGSAWILLGPLVNIAQQDTFGTVKGDPTYVDIKSGIIKVKKADTSDFAASASNSITSGYATEAGHATNADHADNAANANSAINANNANNATNADNAKLAEDSSKLGGLKPSYYMSQQDAHNYFVSKEGAVGRHHGGGEIFNNIKFNVSTGRSSHAEGGDFMDISSSLIYFEVLSATTTKMVIQEDPDENIINRHLQNGRIISYIELPDKENDLHNPDDQILYKIIDYNIIGEGKIEFIFENNGHIPTIGEYAIKDIGIYSSYPTKALGDSSHAEGRGSEATGNYSHAEGGIIATSLEETLSDVILNISGNNIVIFSMENLLYYNKGTVQIDNSESLIFKNIKITSEASSLGGNSVTITLSLEDASKLATIDTLKSHSLRFENTNLTVGNNSKGESSHVEGVLTITTNLAEHAEGRYNISNIGHLDSLKTLSSIGCGTYKAPSNAFEVTMNGDIYIKEIGGYKGQLLQSLTNNIGNGAKVEGIQSLQLVINDILLSINGFADVLDEVNGEII